MTTLSTVITLLPLEWHLPVPAAVTGPAATRAAATVRIGRSLRMGRSYARPGASATPRRSREHVVLERERARRPPGLAGARRAQERGVAVVVEVVAVGRRTGPRVP